MTPTPDRPLTTHQAARILRITPMTVIRWIEGGKLPAWKTAGGHRRIERSTLEAFAREAGIVRATSTDLRAQIEELLATVPDVPDLDAGDHVDMAKHGRDAWFAAGLARGKMVVRDAVRLLLRGEGA